MSEQENFELKKTALNASMQLREPPTENEWGNSINSIPPKSAEKLITDAQTIYDWLIK